LPCSDTPSVVKARSLQFEGLAIRIVVKSEKHKAQHSVMGAGGDGAGGAAASAKEKHRPLKDVRENFRVKW
jgi:hypothetical protein